MSLNSISHIKSDEESADHFLKEKGCLKSTAPKCPICQRDMAHVSQRQENWLFPFHKEKVSEHVGSPWSKGRLSLASLVLLVWTWALGVLVTTASQMLEISEQTQVQWFAYFHDVCSDKLLTLTSVGVLEKSWSLMRLSFAIGNVTEDV